MASFCRIALALLCLAAAAGTAHAGDPLRYSIERVPSPPNFQPQGMNERGDVVGFKLRNGWDPDYVAYRQVAGLPAQTIPDAPGGAEASQLVAINDHGMAVGYVNVKPGSGVADSGNRVDVVLADGQRIDLTPLLPADADSYAVDVNNRGEVAGTIVRWDAQSFDHPDVYKPFVWSQSEGMRFPLGSGLDGMHAKAVAINEDGQLTGLAIDPEGFEDFYIFAWDALRGARYSDRMVWRVSGGNNLGQVVGVALYNDAFVWTAGGGKKRLPHPADQPHASCRANAINDAGIVVGTCRDFEGVVWVPGDDGSYRVVDLWKQIDFPPDFPVWRYPKGERPIPWRIGNDGRILLTYNPSTPPYAGGSGMYPAFSAILTPKP
jgi:hypothetical protein